jgi:hypothetical protein
MNMQEATQTLVAAICADYVSWGTRAGAEVSETRQRMNEEFCDRIKAVEGRKYIKITTGDSVWGFIVATDDDKMFNRGDILKAASWATPTRNKARGNILEEGYTIRWTGPACL